METNYCTQWSRGRKRFHQPMTEAEAAEAHRKGKLYTAVLGDPQRPYCFLEFSAYRSVAVEFLDGRQRTYLDYSFQELDEHPGDLFLSMACIREFDAKGAIRGPVCFFKPDGELIVHHTEYNADTRRDRIVAEEELRTDVSGHWEPYPDFGRYEGLSRIRDIPHLHL